MASVRSAARSWNTVIPTSCAQCRLRASAAPLPTPPSTLVVSARHLAASHVAASHSFKSIRSLSYTSRRPSSQESPSSASTSSPPSTPLPQSHYDLFPKTLPRGPPPASPFPIDTRALRREFLHLQSLYHPDLHPPATKSRAEATSAMINTAYKTLSNPLLRAQYLLSLNGIDVAEDETLKVEEPGLLTLVLEAREEIEDAEQEQDLQGIKDANDERIKGSEGVLQDAFQRDDMEMAKREAVRLRYWINIKESIDNWEKGKPIVLEH